MTMVIAIQTAEGAVLASDSAAGQDDGKYVFTCDKLHELRDGVAILGGGLGGGYTADGFVHMGSIFKDYAAAAGGFRSVPDTARDFGKFMLRYGFEDRTGNVAADETAQYSNRTAVFYVTGLNEGARLPETWKLTVDITDKQVGCERSLQGPATSIAFHGNNDALFRLLQGYSRELPAVLNSAGMPQDQAVGLVQYAGQHLMAPFFPSSLSLAEAIDLADYLMAVAIGYARFSPGPQDIGGEVDIATITKYEGFRWERRKPRFGVSA